MYSGINNAIIDRHFRSNIDKMDAYQIAKLLQISGILIGTGFGTILLNPTIVGKLAHQINSRVFSLGETFTKRYFTISKRWFFRGRFEPFQPEAIGSTQILLSAWVLLSFNLHQNINWTVWISIAILFAYASMYVLESTMRFIRGIPRRYPLWSFPIDLIIRLIWRLLVTPVAVFILLILNYLSVLIVLIFQSIAGKDIVRRGLIITGFGLVLVGLIIELNISA